MRITIIGIILQLLLFSSNCYAEEQTQEQERYKGEVLAVSDVIATVNDKQITTKQLFERLYKLNGQQVLNQMIDELLIQDEAKSQKIDVASKEIEKEIEKLKTQFGDEKVFNNQLAASGMTIEELKKQIELQLVSKNLLMKDKNIQVTDAEINAYFEKNKDKLKKPEQIRVSHILVGTEQEAKDLLVALQAGADFGKLAKAKSMDTASKDKGGDIGFVVRGSLVPEFESVAFGLKKPGDISDIVKTQFGYHIIRLEEKKEPQSTEFTEEIREKIKSVLLQQKIQAEIPGWLQGLRNKAKINIGGIRD